MGATESDIPAASTEALALQDELMLISRKTNRGFQASNSDRGTAREIIMQLTKWNPTAEPARPYYEGQASKEDSDSSKFTIAGKWNLVYTDAPDITSLDTSRNLFSTAELGRIGQECVPPYIKNVIEWQRPGWARGLPLSGSDSSRVLQKVVTLASASAAEPQRVDLKVGGLEFEVPGSSKQIGTMTIADLAKTIQTDGIVAGVVSSNPLDLKGPIMPPFGRFQILYLDESFRVIRTSQNYLAANQRIRDGEEWF